MAIRNILNGNGDVIGSLELPDDTTDDQWTAALAIYTQPPEIKDVSARQIRQALILSGIQLSQIDDAIATMPDPEKTLAQIEWQYSNVFERNRPLSLQVAVMFGWSGSQLDALWVLAGSL